MKGSEKRSSMFASASTRSISGPGQRSERWSGPGPAGVERERSSRSFQWRGRVASSSAQPVTPRAGVPHSSGNPEACRSGWCVGKAFKNGSRNGKTRDCLLGCSGEVAPVKTAPENAFGRLFVTRSWMGGGPATQMSAHVSEEVAAGGTRRGNDKEKSDR